MRAQSFWFAATMGAFIIAATPTFANPIGLTDFSATDRHIDFEDAPSSALSTTRYASQGLTFDNHGFGMAATTAFSSLLTLNSDSKTVFVGAGNGQTIAPGLDLTFTTPVTRLGMIVGTALDADLTLTLYDAENNILDTHRFIAEMNGEGLREAFIALEVDSNVARAHLVSVIDPSLLPSGGSLPPGNTSNFHLDDIWFGADPVDVPEPGTLMLLGAGLFGLTFVRRRHSSHS